MATKLDSRQVVLRAQSPFIGNAANEQLDVVFPRIDAEMAKLYEDRNVMLQNGGIITFTGTQIQFTENLEIVLNQKISGAAPQVIDLGSANVDLADGEMWYAVIDRTAGTASTAVASTLPAVVAANQEVFLIVKRVDAGDGTQRIYWRSGMAMNAGQSNRLGASGSGGSGSGVGDDLGSLLFKASFTDGFDEGPTDVKSAVDTSAGFTDPTAYNAAKAMYTISYDASKTIAVGTTTTNIELSAVAAFTVKIGDIVIANGQARRITAVASQQSFTTEAFTTAPTLASQVTVSQAIYSKDLNNFAVDGLPISDAFSTTISQILLTYEDTTASGDNIFDANTVAVIGYSASSDNSSFTDVSIRPQYLDDTQLVKVLPTASTSLYLRFFANQTSGSGTVNLLGYKAFLHKFQASEDGAILNQAYGRTDGTGTDVSVAAVTVVGGKTRIRVDWAYPVGVNPGKANGSLVVYLDGQKIPRFVDATVSISAYYTEIDQNTIELDADYSSLALEFEVVQSVAVVDASDTNTTNIAQAQEASGIAFQSFVDFSKTISPTSSVGTPAVGTFYSSVINRKSIQDLTVGLGVNFGINRIPLRSPYAIADEFGPNGETVSGVANDTIGMVRLVGARWLQDSSTDSNGAKLQTNNVGDYMEVTFYGTGLNILTHTNSTSNTWSVSVDGGTPTNFVSSGFANPLNNRNYTPNVVINAVNGLTLGIHTVRIALAAGTFLIISGVEIQNSGSSILIQPGSSFYNFKKNTTSAQQSIAYNSSFESGTLGTRGGRVVVYQKSDGTIGKSLTPANASSATLVSADHTNEEVARIFNWREFTAGRSDDFTGTFSAANRAFVLDDGTTTLMASSMSTNNVFTNKDAIAWSGSGAYITLTFLGTGLDVVLQTPGFTGLLALSIDGASEVNFAPTIGRNITTKLVSGLAYGTHTVKIRLNTGANVTLTDFIVYQPKKPTVPAGAVELADYCLAADYSGATITGTAANDNFQMPVGTVTKFGSREMLYGPGGGAWTHNGPGSQNPMGTTVSTTSNNDYVELRFFGTGFVAHLGDSTGGAFNFTVTIDGVLNATGVPRSNITNGGGGTYTVTTGTGGLPARVEFTGLSLGHHVVRVTKTSGVAMNFIGYHIITPIISMKSEGGFSVQGYSLVGSQSALDIRKSSPIKDIQNIQQKNSVLAMAITSGPTTTSTSYVPLTDMSVVIKTNGGLLDISGLSSITNAVNTNMAIFVDGVQVPGEIEIGGSGSTTFMAVQALVAVAPGFHKVDIYWKTSGGTATARLLNRTLKVREI